LPQAECLADISLSAPAVIAAPRGTETILLVEDEPRLRELARHVLQENGYTVLEAKSAMDALHISASYGKPIHLLLTDVVMPEMGGRALAERLLPLHPSMKAIFMSGYTDDAVVRHGILHDQVNFLQKPFLPLALAQKVREVLAE
jgi:two-component system cell cycle sensor histidine kinase/response regulator CckA